LNAEYFIKNKRRFALKVVLLERQFINSCIINDLSNTSR